MYFFHFCVGDAGDGISASSSLDLRELPTIEQVSRIVRFLPIHVKEGQTSK